MCLPPPPPATPPATSDAAADEPDRLEITAGEAHALVGQNGAGKSTLGKIIGGIYEGDAGDFEAFGAPVGNWSPRLALKNGIAMIHQELSLVPELSVAQNVFLGIERHADSVGEPATCVVRSIVPAGHGGNPQRA